MTPTWMRTAAAAVLALAAAGCTVEERTPAGADAAPAAPAGPDPATARALKADTGPPPLLSAKKGDKPKSLQRTQHAITLSEYGNLTGAQAALEEAVELDPTNRTALRLLAQLTQQQASQLGRPQNSPLFLKSASALRRLRDNFPELTSDEKKYLPVVFYNEACTLAVNGEAPRAMKALREACDAGFGDVVQLDTDPELDALRSLPEFQALQTRMEQKNVAALLAATSPFAFDFRLPDPDGKPLALADLKGELTVVDFWGTWCPPCRKETPHLAALYRKYKDRGLRVVGLAYEQERGDAAVKLVKDYLKSADVPFPCVMGDDATVDRVPSFTGFPTTLFVDASGKVRLRLGGYQSLIALETAVQALLPEAQPAKPDGEAGARPKETETAPAPKADAAK